MSSTELKNRLKPVGIISIIACVLLCMIYNTYISNRELQTTVYKIQVESGNERLSDSIRIVQLSDLHNSTFGKENNELIFLVKELHPDLIVMTGDMINREEQNLVIVIQLIRKLVSIAPVYYGYGNHEVRWEEFFGRDLRPILADAGAVVVNNTFVDVEIKNHNIRIGGYMGYYHHPEMMIQDAEEKEIEYRFFDEFEDTNRIKILLNHIPTGWVDWRGIDGYPVDIVFSGHYHGGQWVLPFIGPVYAPYIGFNPPYVKGVFYGKRATCIISGGLGNEYRWLPRLNNPPDIVVADISIT